MNARLSSASHQTFHVSELGCRELEFSKNLADLPDGEKVWAALGRHQPPPLRELVSFFNIGELNVGKIKSKCSHIVLKMHFLEIFRSKLLKLLGIDPYRFLSLQFSMKELPPHKLLSEFSPPVQETVPRLFSDIPLEIHVPRRLTIEVSNVQVSGPAGHLYFGDSLLAESTSWPPEVALLSKPIARLKNASIMPGTFIVLGEASYYHFLLENLGVVLSLIEEFPEATVLAPESSLTYLRDSLELLPKGTRVERYTGEVQLEKVILATRRETLGRPQPREVSSLVRLAERHQVTNDPEPESTKLYISRRRARRSVESEVQLEKRLEVLGFQIVFPEDIPLESQIQLFATSSVVVAPHGAGLANIVFAPSGTRVVELLDPRWPNHCFELLAMACSHKFSRILIDPNDSGSLNLALDIERVLSEVA